MIYSHGGGKVYDSLWEPRNELLLLPQSHYWNLLCTVNFVLL